MKEVVKNHNKINNQKCQKVEYQLKEILKEMIVK